MRCYYSTCYQQFYFVVEYFWKAVRIRFDSLETLCAPHLDVVVGADDVGVIFYVKSIIEIQSDRETLLQLDSVETVRAFRVWLGKIYTGDQSRTLGVYAVTALHWGNTHTNTRL